MPKIECKLKCNCMPEENEPVHTRNIFSLEWRVLRAQTAYGSLICFGAVIERIFIGTTAERNSEVCSFMSTKW